MAGDSSAEQDPDENSDCDFVESDPTHRYGFSMTYSLLLCLSVAAGHRSPPRSPLPLSSVLDLIGETTCRILLQNLQHIWDEVGESDEEQNNILLELEQEYCLDAYRRKVNHAEYSRLQLLQALAVSKLVVALGEKSLVTLGEIA